MNEEMIHYIIDGYSIQDLNLLIRRVKIKIKGFSEVKKDNRDIVIGQLLKQKNLFKIYQTLKSNLPIEYREDLDISFEELISAVKKDKRSELISYYLTNMIRKDGMDKTVRFWDMHEQLFLELKTVGSVQNDEEKYIESNKDLRFETENIKLKKQLDKERRESQQKLNTTENKVKEKEDKIEKLLKENKEIKKTIEQMKASNKNNEKNEDLVKRRIAEKTEIIGKLQKEKNELQEKNNVLIKENIKKNEFIDGLEYEIKRLKKKNLELEKNISNTDTTISDKGSSYNFNNVLDSETVKFLKKDIVKDTSEGKKILVFGDLLGLSDINEDKFEMISSYGMVNDLSLFDGSIYSDIWLIKYRFSKKTKRNQVIEKFPKVKVINTYKELEGVYKNAL